MLYHMGKAFSGGNWTLDGTAERAAAPPRRFCKRAERAAAVLKLNPQDASPQLDAIGLSQHLLGVLELELAALDAAIALELSSEMLRHRP